jgi:hypothetical protein
VLLYAILTDSSHRGMVAAMGDASTVAQGPVPVKGTNFTAFKDAWGTPVTYRRFFGADNSFTLGFQVPEVQRPPYLNAKLASKDPLDPRGKLAVNWPTPANKTTVQNAVGAVFNNQNKLITVISAGPNTLYEHADVNQFSSSDDLYGFRLHKQGNRGD